LQHLYVIQNWSPLVSPKIMKIGKTGPNSNFKLLDN
jgi:hypothetical protein